MDESYFTANRHRPKSMTEGEEFSAAHFVNDPNRRAPPPMLRPGTVNPEDALEWTPAGIADGVSTAAANEDRFSDHRHAHALMGGSGGTADRLASMDVYQEVVDTITTGAWHESVEMPAERQQPPPAQASSPFGAGRHSTATAAAAAAAVMPTRQQPAAPPAEEPLWFMAGPPVAPPSGAPPVQTGPPAPAQQPNTFEALLAMNAAAAASARAIEAMEGARNGLEQQIRQEKQNHTALLKMIGQMKNQQ